MRRRLTIAIGLALMASLLVGPALAGKPMPLTLVLESGGQVNPPNTCMNEDDIHVRDWTGFMRPGDELIATERMCDPELDGTGAGGTGLFLLVSSRSPLTAYIHQPAPQDQDNYNWPPPPYPYPDVPVIGPSGGGRACIVPVFNLVTEIGEGALAGGEYQIIVRNDGSRTARDIRVQLTARMAWPFQQQNRCPLEYQNLE